MRNFVLRIAAIATLCSTSYVMPSAARAEPATEIIEFCKEVITAPPHTQDEATLGECNSFFQSQGTDGFAAHLCDFLIEAEGLEMKFSDCVKAVRDGSLLERYGRGAPPPSQKRKRRLGF